MTHRSLRSTSVSLHAIAVAALLVAGGLSAAPALAGDTPLSGPPPAWVKPAPPIDIAAVSGTEGVVPVFDEQVLVDGDHTTAYVDFAQRIANAEQLQKAGTLTASWQPAHGDLTIHRIEILRGGAVIDLLADGPKFTVLRREAGLESQVVDGKLTAVRQIEGLRIGDILRLAISTSEHDAALGGRTQSGVLLLPKPARIGFGRARLLWPTARPVLWKSMLAGVSPEPRAIDGGLTEITLPLPIAELPKMPGALPPRFQPVPVISVTTFADWQDVARTMAPLFDDAGTIADGSDLAQVVDRIAAQHADPLGRMNAALRTVQSEVRYLLVAMDSGNYVPQAPARTWELRYGDCKAKTMLLIAMLHRMGITAEPVLVNARRGDGVIDALPAPMAFDHVIVRAEVAGESFWLDGTSLGSRMADIRDVPRFGFGLPLRPGGAELVRLPVRANARPSPDVELAYDAGAGPYLPAPFTLKVRYAGASAESTRESIGGGSPEKLREIAENLANKWAGSKTVIQPTVAYDAEAATLTIAMAGLRYPDWSFRDGRLELATSPALGVEFSPDRTTSAWRPLPALIENPWTAHTRVTLELPADAAAAALDGTAPIAIDLPALHYARTVTRSGLTVTEEVTSAESGAEVPVAEIPALRRAVGSIGDAKLQVMLPADYPQRWDTVRRSARSPAVARIRKVLDQRIVDQPDEAWRHADRGWLEARLLDYAAAEKFYDKAIAIDPEAALYLTRAGVRSNQGKHDGALADAQAAYDLDQSNKEARATLAGALARLDRTDEALDLVDAGADPSSDEGVNALLSRADILLQGKRYDEAVETLDAGLRKRASSPDLLNSRCWIKAIAGTDLDGALADCNRAIDLAANPATYFDSRAMVHYRAGRMDAAVKDLDAALALEPEIAGSLFMRGLIERGLGQAARSQADLAAARQLSPTIESFFARLGIKP